MNKLGLVHFHNHSTYSNQDGQGTPEKIVQRAKNLGQKAIAITDHGNTYGHVAFQKAARKEGIKPIFGIEAYIVEDALSRTREQSSLGANAIPHITILAKDQTGYKNLVKLVNWSFKNGFYYKPRIDTRVLFEYQEGLIVTTGCPTAFPTRLIFQGKHADAYEFVQTLSENVQNLYVEIVAQPGYAPSEAAVETLISYASCFRKKILITGDNHFTEPKDYPSQHLMTRVGIGNPFREPAKINIPSYQYICSDEELLTRAMKMWKARPNKEKSMISDDKAEKVFQWGIANTGILADEIEVEISSKSSVYFPGRKEESPEEYIRRKCMDGMKKKISNGFLAKDREILSQYISRMDFEIGVLSKKKFIDYILLISDIAIREKEKGYMCVCRGSAGGCLLLYLLGASETDPIKFDLSFERFFNETRNDPPDIDLDFERKRRDIVVGEIEELYGHAKVAKIAAFTEYTLKSALIDAARMHEVPRSAIEPALSILNDLDDKEETSSTSAQSHEIINDLYNEFPQLRVAEDMVGQIRNQTINAAGLIISSENIYETISVYERPGTPRIIATDKIGAEQLGFLKADIMSVSSLDVIDECVRLISLKVPGFSIESLYKLPLDDANVFELIRSGDVVGIFQVDGSVMKVENKVKIENFDELCAASALCRPGAMHYVPIFAQNKFNKSRLEHSMSVFHPKIAEILRPTYSVIVYQEQVNAIARLAGLSWEETHTLRKLIAKSKDEEILPYCDKLTKGLISELGMSEIAATMLVKNIRDHGKYSFNKSHCYTYGLIGYWMGWMKHYYPHEYYNAFISLELAAATPDYILIRRLISEAKRNDYIDTAIPLVPTLIKPVTFISDSKMIGGFPGIHGAGKKKGGEIARRFIDKNLTKKQAELASYLTKVSLNATLSKVNEMGAILHWFPWFPVVSPENCQDYGEIFNMLANHAYMNGPIPRFNYEDRDPFDGEIIEQRQKIYGPSELLRNGYQKNIYVAGYLTAKRRKQRTIAMRHEIYLGYLEDHISGVELRITGETPEIYGRYKSEVKRGDFLCVQGNWNGTNFIVKDFTTMVSANIEIESDYEEEFTENEGES